MRIFVVRAYSVALNNDVYTAVMLELLMAFNSHVWRFSTRE